MLTFLFILKIYVTIYITIILFKNINIMETNNNKILLYDLLNLEDLSNVKTRFNMPNNREESSIRFDPMKFYKEDINELLWWHFWNWKSWKSFKKWEIVIWLAKIEWDKWLLFNISKITGDLDKPFERNAYEYETLEIYKKYFGRTIIKFHNTCQKLIRK